MVYCLFWWRSNVKIFPTMKSSRYSWKVLHVSCGNLNSYIQLYTLSLNNTAFLSSSHWHAVCCLSFAALSEDCCLVIVMWWVRLWFLLCFPELGSLLWRTSRVSLATLIRTSSPGFVQLSTDLRLCFCCERCDLLIFIVAWRKLVVAWQPVAHQQEKSQGKSSYIFFCKDWPSPNID